MAIDGDSNVYVSDWGNHRIQVFDPQAGSSASGGNRSWIKFPDPFGGQTAKLRPPDLCLGAILCSNCWCRERDSNPHTLAGNGF